LILGIDTVVILMVVVGGRVVPAFTTGALRKEGVNLRKSPLLDRVAILSVLLVLLADLIVPESVGAGYVALFAAAAQIARISGWRSWHTRHAPILWVLHLGYGWIALGLALKGAADAFGWISPEAGLHGLSDFGRDVARGTWPYRARFGGRAGVECGLCRGVAGGVAARVWAGVAAGMVQ
jgi:uncharacterized protein involved in response to NO